MHDPSTVAFTIRYPWRRWAKNGAGERVKRYRQPLITIWHVDPETDGSDDSCGWFKRARHGNPVVLKAIQSDFAFDWDADWGGWFDKQGHPLMSSAGITVNMFWTAAFHHFGKSRRRAERFMRRELFDVLRFAENTTDSMHPLITQRYGREPREDRIAQCANIVYGYVLRSDQRWWQHARWHFWHWRLQIHPWQQLYRWLFVRCARCGKRFGWNESPVGFMSGDDIWHSDCMGKHQADHRLRQAETAGTA